MINTKALNKILRIMVARYGFLAKVLHGNTLKVLAITYPFGKHANFMKFFFKP